MRVTLLCLDPGVPFGGVKGCSIHLRSVARALMRAGHAVQIVCAREGPAVDDVPGHTLRTAPPGTSDAVLETLLADSDLVIERLALLAPEGASAAERLQIPHVYEVNAPLDREAAEHRGFTRGAEARAAFQRGFSRSNGAIAVSDEVAQWVRRLAPAGFRVRVVPNGVDPVFFDEPSDLATRRALLRIPPSGAFRIGYVGSFKPWHDLDSLIEAAAMLGETRQVELVMVGHGPSVPDVLRLAHARRVPLTLVGAVPHADVPALMLRCDALAVTYASAEAYFSPLKLVEAMATGRPVVASATPSCRRMIRHMETGLLVEPGNPTALAAALGLCARDPVLGARLGAAARREARAQRTWDAVVASVLDFSQRTQRRIHA